MRARNGALALMAAGPTTVMLGAPVRDIRYTMKGQATLDTPVGKQVVPFTLSGRAPLTRSGGTTLPSVSP